MFLDDLAVRYGREIREAKWRLYSQFFPPRRGERVLDVGVSHLDHLANENYFLKRYPYPEQLTGVGVTDLSKLPETYPGVTFVTADGRDLPFEDREFDVVHSNAVVEHVGDEREQARFVHELVRVARAGFITTPNRLFPFDSHTRLPFLHWLPRPLMIRAYAAVGRPEEGIWLLTRRGFERLFPGAVDLHVTTQRIAGFPATTSIVFFRR